MDITEYYVSTNIKESVLEIEFFNRRANSINSEMLKELSAAFDSAAKDDSVLAIVLKSKGEKVFASGASFDEMLGIEDFGVAKEFFLGFARLIWSMLNCPKFIITIIQGKAIGGSVGITAASDYVVATENAEFRLSEYSVGIGPFVIAPVIEKKIGLAPLMEMTIDTEYRSAQWALEKGLVFNIQKDLDSANEFAYSLAKKISQRNPKAVEELKSLFWEKERTDFSIYESRAEKSAKLLLTDFTKNFLKEFIK
jgi:methylglutaconyl-CoA hydratase